MFLKTKKHLKSNKCLNLFFLLLFFVLNTRGTIAQDSLQNDKIINVSMELVYFLGHFNSYDYEIYPNFGVRLLKLKKIEIHSKIGLGIRMPIIEPSLSSVQFYLEAFYGKKKHFLVSGIGIMKIGSQRFHVPLIIGYKYVINSNNSIMLQVNPLLWSTYKGFDGYNNTERTSTWIWDDLGYGLRLGYYFYF